MFTREELNQIEQLKTDKPTFQYLFDKTNKENQYTLSHISHSIRNDLTVLMSSFQLMETCHPEVRTFKYWEEYTKSAVHIRDFLDEVSDYCNSSRLNCSFFNLDKLLDDIVCSVSHKPESCPASVCFQTEASCPDFYGDPAKLRHAFELIVKNSCEAVSEDNGKIDLSLSFTDNFLQISVSDNGKGFSEEIRKNLWTPFSSDKKHHSGLGLCTANNIILSHGGYMDLAYTGPDGTCMAVYLPLSQSGKYK